MWLCAVTYIVENNPIQHVEESLWIMSDLCFPVWICSETSVRSAQSVWKRIYSWQVKSIPHLYLFLFLLNPLAVCLSTLCTQQQVMLSAVSFQPEASHALFSLSLQNPICDGLCVSFPHLKRCFLHQTLTWEDIAALCNASESVVKWISLLLHIHVSKPVIFILLMSFYLLWSLPMIYYCRDFFFKWEDEKHNSFICLCSGFDLWNESPGLSECLTYKWHAIITVSFNYEI